MAHLMFGALLAKRLEDRRRQIQFDRQMIRDVLNPFSISDEQFVLNFRLSKVACLDLLREIEPHMEVGRYCNRIPVHIRFLSALHFFAMGSYQRSARNCPLTCVSQPVVSRAVTEVCNILIIHCIKRWIRFPRNNEEKRNISQRFQVKFKMPHIIGVIDGTQIAIVKPTDNEHAYVNRKGYHSINVQIICDDNLKIISVMPRYPGSAHDAFVWHSSSIRRNIQENYENGNTSSRLMGDSGYPCQPWLLTPLYNPKTVQEQQFNYRLKTTRSIVERCIGILKGRFRCLLNHRTLHYQPLKAAKIIMACAILHNVAIHYRVGDLEPNWDDIDLENVRAQDPEDDVYYSQLGQQSRAQYIEQYF